MCRLIVARLGFGGRKSKVSERDPPVSGASSQKKLISKQRDFKKKKNSILKIFKMPSDFLPLMIYFLLNIFIFWNFKQIQLGRFWAKFIEFDIVR